MQRPGGDDRRGRRATWCSSATPIDLRRVIEIDKPALRVGYELQEIGKPDLEDVLARF